EPVRADGLPADVAYSLAAGEGEVWVGRRSGALTRISSDGISAHTYRAAEGQVARPVYAVHVARGGTVAAGSLGGGLDPLRRGRVHDLHVEGRAGRRHDQLDRRARRRVDLGGNAQGPERVLRWPVARLHHARGPALRRGELPPRRLRGHALDRHRRWPGLPGG